MSLLTEDKNRLELRGFFFIAPAIIFLFFIIIYPLFTVFRYSFQEYTPHQSFVFVGLKQYQNLFASELFWISIRNTFLFTIGTIILDLAISWGIALLLNARWPNFKVRNFFRGALLLPFLFSAPAAALLWGILYQPLGLLNYVIEQVSGTTISFLGDSRWALFSVLWVNVWKNFPLIMILILGGLQSIPQNLYEAARIDGANRVQSFWHITLPQMRSLMMTIIVIDFATTFIHFDLVWTMTKGGPLRSTYLISFFLYQRGMHAFKFGYASAIGAVTALIISVCIGIYIFLYSKRVEAQA
ncbi:MAG: carbohydrate ABC transporter permease [bacterium]